MGNTASFSNLLKEHVIRTYYTPGQLSKLTGLPKATIVNWMEGRVNKPRYRADLLRLAAALHLDVAAATELLQSAGYPSLSELLSFPDDEEARLLAHWNGALHGSNRSPFQAIADLPYFVGRTEVLQKVTSFLTTSQHNRIVCLHGMAGVGKTTLAARLAYLLRPSFPDGVLWAQLDAADTMSIMGLFANAFGRDVSSYTDVQSRSAVLRELLSGRRALLILDNAVNSEQVMPLLPPTGGCAVILTTRYHSLSVVAGLPSFEIEPFDSARGESLDLFTRILGHENAQREKECLAQIGALLGQLPLAIAITASRLAHEPGWTAVDLLARLDRGERLDELSYDSWNMRVLFQASYDALPSKQQHFFSSLGVFETNDFGAEAAAAINDVPVEEAQATLRALYSLSLVQQGRGARYRLHPLLSEFAKEMSGTGAAFCRMSEYYVSYAEEHRDDYRTLDLELSNILQGLRIAQEQAMPELLLRGVSALYPFLEKRGLYALALDHLKLAKEAAILLGNNEGLSVTLRDLGRIYMRMGDNAQAELLLQEGLELARCTGNSRTVCDLLVNLGATALNMSKYKEAEQYLLDGLTLAHETGYYKKAGVALAQLGILERRYGHFEKASDYFIKGLRHAQETGDAETTIRILTSLSSLAAQLGKYEQAGLYIEEGLALAGSTGDREASVALLINAGCLEVVRENLQSAERRFIEGLAIAREMGHINRVNYFLVNLGEVASRQGRDEDAESYLREALAVSRRVGEAWMVGNTLLAMGQFNVKLSRMDVARPLFLEAYELARELNLSEIRAKALFELANIAFLSGNIAQARSYGEETLSVLRSTSMDETKQRTVQGWLAALS
jgi:tetratricopeptide (TPR) repeat protein